MSLHLQVTTVQAYWMDTTSGSSTTRITAYAAIPKVDALTYTGTKRLRMCALVNQGSRAEGTLVLGVTASSSASTLSIHVHVTTAAFTIGDTAGLMGAAGSGDVTLFIGDSASSYVEGTRDVADLNSFQVCAQLEKYYPELLGEAGTLTLTAMYKPTERTAVLSNSAQLAVRNADGKAR
ncbi:MAG: hypothetical protein EOM68_23850 [Spirochaetia bacterium]|nr:hypothetical protein [Spirochaetia bacterium]